MLSHQFFPVQLLCPKTSLLGGLKYFKLSLLNSSPDATAPVPEESRLSPHRWILPGFTGALQHWRCWQPCSSLPWGVSGLLVSLHGLSWAWLLPSCCGELCLSLWQSSPLHLHMSSPDCRGGLGGEDREVVYTAHHPLRSACSPAYIAGVSLQREQGMEYGDRFELSGTCHSRAVIHPHVCRIWLHV